jgi:hypothetical protein
MPASIGDQPAAAKCIEAKVGVIAGTNPFHDGTPHSASAFPLTDYPESRNAVFPDVQIMRVERIVLTFTNPI